MKTSKNESPTFGKEIVLPLQKLLKGDYLRVMPLNENIHSLSVVPHRHDHYELLYITKGQGTHFINFKEYDVKPGRIYFMHPGNVHLINRFSRSGWLIMFGQELFKRFLNIHQEEGEMGLLDSYTPYPYVDLDSKQVNVFKILIEQLNFELAAEKQDAAILLHYTALLLLQANRAHKLQHPIDFAPTRNSIEFHKLKHLIEEHFKDKHQASFYVSMLKTDIKKLNRICRLSTGYTLSGLLKERLLTESKIQLQTSPLSVKEVSYHLGFNDPAFFGRFFKMQTGLTPAEFRNVRLI